MLVLVFLMFFGILSVNGQTGNHPSHGPSRRRCEDPNAIFVPSPNPCPRTCAFPGARPCNKAPVKEGCECKPGFYLDDRNRCVQLQHCPGARRCSANETFVFCNFGCPIHDCPKTDSQGIIACSPPYPCGSGCACRKDHLRGPDGRCVQYSDCPPIKCTRPNEVYSANPPPCLFDKCSDIGKDNVCDSTYPNRPQCVCGPGFYRDENYVCVSEEECSKPKKCGLNEIHKECITICPPQSCDIMFKDYFCLNSIECISGCDCIPGYLRDDNDNCIPKELCPAPPVCNITPECRATCANPEPNCCSESGLPLENQDGCKCKEGYVLSDANGPCVLIEECPDTGCNGDPNSMVTKCPWPCPSLCSSPDAGLYDNACEPIGCQCKPGFILDDCSGKCILPEKCPSGNPCGINGTLTECAFGCPNQYCPQDDSLTKVACRPVFPCPSGCACKPYYLKKSYDDETCVLASDCPPVKCTRPNEEWNPCASELLAESCSDVGIKSECYPDPRNCQPQCVCYKGFYRNHDGICVPKDKCPKTCNVRQECRPTCAVPIPENCPYILPSESNDDSCNCQAGYVLSESGGQCIRVEECQAETCNNDPHARIREYPQACPSTCSIPNAYLVCKRKQDPIGCECQPGYLRADNGTCILPDECPGGNPCGENEMFSPCLYQCPTNFCPIDDSRAILVCESSPFSQCQSGCTCRLNHKRLSVDNPKCIVSSDCPPVNCTRQNEVWTPCSSECQSEYCDAVDEKPTVCNTLVLNCNPGCRCQEGYFRRGDDLCVCSDECRELNRVQG